MSKIPIITIQGPTAAGKSALALELSHVLGGEIISVDSRQVYRGMDIGTAKPSLHEREQVPHHLIDVVDPDEKFSAGRFAAMAAPIISNLHERGVVPILCGGTGFYLEALTRGLFEAPAVDEALRHKLEGEWKDLGPAAMYARLATVDPEAAAVIAVTDRQRVLRALEIFYATGKSRSQHWQEQQTSQPYKKLAILVQPERSLLYQRIDTRLQKMLDNGLIEEINGLLAKGYNQDCPGLSALGYREFLPVPVNEPELKTALELACQHSRNYAKRQITWYRRRNFAFVLTEKAYLVQEVNNIAKTYRSFAG